MRETEADRILRDRQRQEHRIAEEASRQREAEVRALEQSLAQQLALEIEQILPLLAARGYPGMTAISVRDRGDFLQRFFDELFSPAPIRRVQKAAWHLGDHSYWFSGYGDSGYTSAPVYLLSDGHIYCQDVATVPSQLGSTQLLQLCLDGVRDLRRSI